MGYITSNSLNFIDKYTKELINKGIFFLYKIEDNKYNYLLKADDIWYLIPKEGVSIKKINMEEAYRFNYTEWMYFSDVEFPPSVDSLLSACNSSISL